MKTGWKGFTYFYLVCVTVSLGILAWFTKGFTVTDYSVPLVLAVLVTGPAGVAFFMEPVMMSDPKIGRFSFKSVIVRALLAGSIIVGTWGGLYLLGLLFPGDELFFLVPAVVLALVIGLLGTRVAPNLGTETNPATHPSEDSPA